MPTINDWPAISKFVATPSIGSISLNTEYVDPHQPNGLPYLKTVVFEYWASATDDVETATKVAEGLAAAKWDDAALIGGVTRYLWVRPRREARLNNGNTVETFGDFYPEGNGAAVEIYSDTDEWVAYTPTCEPESGAFADVSVTGRYKRRGKSVIVQALAEIENGTGSGGIRISAPFQIKGTFLFVGSGVCDSATANCIVYAGEAGGEAFFVVLKYDGTHPVAGTNSVAIQIEFEPEE